MDPITMALSCMKTGLEIFKIVIEDIPKENRAQAWKDWYDFWHGVYAKLDLLGK